jgi:hypothetical protein
MEKQDRPDRSVNSVRAAQRGCDENHSPTKDAAQERARLGILISKRTASCQRVYSLL